MPLNGYWSEGYDNYFGYKTLYYFDGYNIFYTPRWNGEQMTSENILWSSCYNSISLSLSVDGTITIPIKNYEVNTSWDITVLSNDKIEVKGQGNPKTFNLLRMEN